MRGKYGQTYFVIHEMTWPTRNKIIDDMPSEFKKNFPTTLIMIDGPVGTSEQNTSSAPPCLLY